MGKKRSVSNSEISLAQLLDCQYNAATKPKKLGSADDALLAEQFADAACLYASTVDPSLITQAKHGFCLAMKGDDDAAEKLLTQANVGDHPVAQAVLAWVLGGRHGRRLHGFGNAEAKKQRRAAVQSLLDAALMVEHPPELVFRAAFEVLGAPSKPTAVLAERARQLYPNWSWPHAIVASSLRVAGELKPAVLDDLMRTLTTARHEGCFHEAYAHALQLGRWDDADRTVEALDALVRADPQQGSGNVAALAEMRAMVALHRARDGQPEMYEQIPVLLAPFVGAAAYAADGCDPMTAPKFLLQVALETRDGDGVRDATNTLIDRAWLLQSWGGEDLDSWGPLLSTPSLEGVVHFHQFRFDFTTAWRQIEQLLQGEARDRWRLLVAANAVVHREPEADQVQVLREARDHDGPWWLGRAVYQAHVEHEPRDFAGAGAMLASLAERAQAMPTPEDERMPSHLEMLAIDLQGSDDVVEMFEGAFAWLQATTASTGQALLREWGDCLADNGGKPVLGRIAALSLSRADSAVARESLALAQEPDDELRTELEEALAHYPNPDTTRVRPDELTLLEAASLIALLRASPLDHVRWTLSSLREVTQRFEPTQKFIGTLFGLMNKGVIAIDASTPAGVVEIQDGRLRAFLDRVVWRVSAHTLELSRAIRELPRRDWPDEWRGHAPVLARDLGVEELAVYLEHLLDERSLPNPNMEEVREIFRVQLEQLAVAQCYYLAHKTMKEALDYQARHHPGVKQLQVRLINLLRGNGEKAIAQQWDTRYERIREFPPSLLYEALHDVLTGWGRAAFDEPVMALLVGASEAEHH